MYYSIFYFIIRFIFLICSKYYFYLHNEILKNFCCSLLNLTSEHQRLLVILWHIPSALFRYDSLSCVCIELRCTIISAWWTDSQTAAFSYFRSVVSSFETQKVPALVQQQSRGVHVHRIEDSGQTIARQEITAPDRMPKRTQPFEDLRGDPRGVWSRQFRTWFRLDFSLLCGLSAPVIHECHPRKLSTIDGHQFD